MNHDEKARKRTIRDMRRWTQDTFYEAREREPGRPALAIAISSDLDYFYLLYSKPNRSPRGSRKGEGTFNDHEEMLGRMAKSVWHDDDSAVVHLSHWPTVGDYGTMELDAPGKSKGSCTEPDLHWLLNLMCLAGQLFPVDQNGQPFDQETLSAMAERQQVRATS